MWPAVAGPSQAPVPLRAWVSGEGFWEGLPPPPARPSAPLSHPPDTMAPSYTEELPNCPPRARRAHLPREVGPDMRTTGNGAGLSAGQLVSSGPPGSDLRFTRYLRSDLRSVVPPVSEAQRRAPGMSEPARTAAQSGSCPGRHRSTQSLAVQGRNATLHRGNP